MLCEEPLLLKIVRQPRVELRSLQHPLGCGVHRCRCDGFHDERKDRAQQSLSKCCERCGHAWMYHTVEQQHQQLIADVTLTNSHQDILSHGSEVLQCALQSERHIELKMVKSQSLACGASGGESLPLAKEAFALALKTLEELGNARSTIDPSTFPAYARRDAEAIRSEMLVLMKRLMTFCETAQSSLTHRPPSQRSRSSSTSSSAPSPNLAVQVPRAMVANRGVAMRCPKCDEFSSGRYCSSCGHEIVE